MAEKDITLKRNNSGTVDILNPTTTWTQVNDKPSTFTPTDHTHDNTDIVSTGVTDGYVLTADGSGGTAWEAVSAGSTFDGGTITGNIEISNTLPKITFTDTNNNSDFNIANNNGVFTIGDTTNQIDRFKVYSSGDVAMPVDAKFTIGESTTTNEAKIVLDVSNFGHPQIGLAENNDASWAIGVDDNDNGFKIHGADSATIPTIAGLSTPHFELDTAGNLYLQKRIYLTTNSYIEYNSTNDSIDFFFT